MSHSPQEQETNASVHKSSPGKRALLWFLAVLIMLSAIIYQRRTGPTYPLRGSYELGGETYHYKLIRSHETTADAPVTLPASERILEAKLYYKRYKTGDSFSEIQFEKKDKKLVAHLPKQPAAGKLEYYLKIAAKDKEFRIPAPKAEENIIIRFKDPVPAKILWPHIFMMFFAVLFGMRAGLGALFAPDSMRLHVWVAVIGMTVGGMILGPVVQKYAFGEYWTGFPFGGDWTDNKMLVMWVVWLVAAAAVGFKPKKKEGVSRAVVVVAAIVMTIAYLIPHSMHGSELDYSKVEQGLDPAKAIRTGRE